MKFLPRGSGLYLFKVFLLMLIVSMLSLVIYQFHGSRLFVHQKEIHVQVQNPSKLHKKPSVHPQQPVSEDMLLEDIQMRMPNLPVAFWNKNKKKSLQKNSTCARFPDLFSIEFNNMHWQTLYTTNGTFQLYGAYLDVRKNNQFAPMVRILSMINRLQPTVITYCQFWFDENKTPIIVKAFEYKYVWVRQWGNYRQGVYQPYLIGCRIPKEYSDFVPASVSMVEKQCDNATTHLKVVYDKPEEKKDFAVCVKGLAFPQTDLSAKLAEWIELLLLVGADKIFLYELEVHPNVKKLLNYYEEKGKVHVTPLKLPGGQPNAPLLQSLYLKKKFVFKRQNELIPYNDCFYKHMYEYKYIVLLDTDEIIMPVGHNSWKELIDKAVKEAWTLKPIERASFNIRNVYFLDDLLHDHGWFKGIPKYMHMLQHVYRAKNFTKPGFYIKSFHNTEKVLALHNHYPLSCLGSCYSYPVNTEDAQLQHYRSDCVSELKKTCADFKNNSVEDTNIWKFKEPLIERVQTALRTLGYISQEEEGRR